MFFEKPKKKKKKVSSRVPNFDSSTSNILFFFQMQAPSKKMAVSGFLKSANILVMSVKKSESDKDDMEATFVLNPNARNIHMDLNYDQGKFISLLH